jgi:hypothetical protein
LDERTVWRDFEFACKPGDINRWWCAYFTPCAACKLLTRSPQYKYMLPSSIK